MNETTVKQNEVSQSMREMFKHYYSLNDDKLKELWNAEDTLFVFDTNVLLNFYDMADEQIDEFFKVLDKLLEVANNRIWLPYHVALEFHRRCNELVYKKTEKINIILEKLDNYKNLVIKNLEDFDEFGEDFADVKSDLILKAEQYSQDIFEKMNEQLTQLPTHTNDLIRDKIINFFDDKVGMPHTKEWLEKELDEADTRLKNKVPPAYSDSSKNNMFRHNNIDYKQKFGDLIIWKEIIKYAKEKTFNTVFFITDDIKPDWCSIHETKGQTKNIIVGARAELKEEIFNLAGVENFEIFQPHKFLEYSSRFIRIEVSDELKDDFNKKNVFVLKVDNVNTGENLKEVLEEIYKYPELEKSFQELQKTIKDYYKQTAFHNSDSEKLFKSYKKVIR